MKNSSSKSVQQVFKTANDEILIVTATTQCCGGRKYVSVTANTISPILVSEAKKRVREELEDGELWRMAVKANQTELGLDEFVEMVLSNDELDGFDNSLYPHELTIEGEDYIFDSRSCGCLHDDILAVTDHFNALIDLHLKDNDRAIEKAEKLISKLKQHDVDHKVERFTREILGVTA